MIQDHLPIQEADLGLKFAPQVPKPLDAPHKLLMDVLKFPMTGQVFEFVHFRLDRIAFLLEPGQAGLVLQAEKQQMVQGLGLLA